MLRKTFVLALLMLLVCGDAAFARHGRRRCRQQSYAITCCQSCAPCNTCNNTHGEYYREYYCLQDLWLDLLGDHDVYFCQVHEGTCPNPNFYEDLWFGKPDYPAPGPDNSNPPQDCSLGRPCEYTEWGENEGPVPGHGKTFTAKNEVYNWIKANLAEGTSIGPTSEYYAFQHGVQKWVGVVVEITARNTGTRTLCVLTGVLSGEPAPIAINLSEPPKLNGTRTMLRVKYNGGSRNALIWLATPLP